MEGLRAVIQSFLRRTSRDIVFLSAILVFSVLTNISLFTSGIPRGFDAPMHLFRMVALDQELRDGVLYPRWFDFFVFGYGYPLLHYYAPLTYYVGEVLHLIGLTMVDAFKAECLLIRAAGGIGAYFFTHEVLSNRLAGLSVATAFILVPYQYTDLYERTAIPEVLAFNLLPIVLWATHRIATDERIGVVAVGAISLALLVLTHQSTALVSGTVVALLASFHIGRQALTRLGSVKSIQLGVRYCGQALLALALSAFFWLPAMLDRAYVPLEHLPPGTPPFVEQLLAAQDLVQKSLIFEHAFPAFARLGLVEVVLALAGLVVALTVSRSTRPLFLLFAFFDIVFTVGMSTLSRPIWELLPFVTLMQFPYRLKIYTSFATAFLIGGFALIPERWPRWVTVTGALLALAAGSLAGFRGSFVSLPSGVLTPATFARLEMSGRYAPIGTTVPAQFLPLWVKTPPGQIYYSQASATGASKDSLTATVRAVSRAGGELQLDVGTVDPFTLRLHTFYFPGWFAQIDGRSVEVAPSEEEALLSLPVPRGNHRVSVGFGRSGYTLIASLISVCAFGVVAFLVLASFIGSFRRRGAYILSTGVLVLILGSIILRLVLPTTSQSPAIHPSSVSFPSGISLAGWAEHFDLQPARGQVAFDLYWFTQRDISADYEVVLTLVDPQGHPVVDYRRQPLWGAMPTSTWYQGELVRDIQRLVLPGNLAAGTNSVKVGLRLIGEAGAEMQTIGTINIPTLDDARGSAISSSLQPFIVDFADGLSLRAFHIEPSSDAEIHVLHPGDTVRVDLQWQAREEIPLDAAVSVFLVNTKGEKFGIQDSYPPHDYLFTGAWDRGDIYFQRFTIPVPNDLSPGLYSLAVEAYDFHTGRRLPAVSGVIPEGSSRTALTQYAFLPARVPAPQHRLQEAFDQRIELEGYDLQLRPDPSGLSTRIDVGLHWQAIHPLTESYTVFVHLYDQAGHLVAQHDGPPLQGALPTTAWNPRQSIIDHHEIIVDSGVPPGRYVLTAGLYSPSTGQRLLATDGTSEVELDHVSLFGLQFGSK